MRLLDALTYFVKLNDGGIIGLGITDEDLMNIYTRGLHKPQRPFRFRLLITDRDDISASVVSVSYDYRRSRAVLRMSDNPETDAWVHETCRSGINQMVLDVLDAEQRPVRHVYMNNGRVIEHNCSFDYEKTDPVVHHLLVGFERISRVTADDRSSHRT